MKRSLRQYQLSESYRVGILLAFAGGFLDVYTYSTRGGVFANAQTGNIVFLGISLANGDHKKALFYCWPIVAFFVGTLVTEWIRLALKGRPWLHWRQIAVTLEFIVLWTIAFIPSGKCDDAVNVAVAFVCSLQVESFRRFHGSAYTTTMCTGNLRSAAEQLFLAGAHRDLAAFWRSLQYIGIILCFIFGAVFGMKVTAAFDEKSVLVVCLLLLVVFVLMFIPLPEKKPSFVTDNRE